MYDSGIVKDILQKTSRVIETITERASAVKNPNELLCSPGGGNSSLTTHIAQRQGMHPLPLCFFYKKVLQFRKEKVRIICECPKINLPLHWI